MGAIKVKQRVEWVKGVSRMPIMLFKGEYDLSL